MASASVIWSKEDYDEYGRQLKLISEAYPSLPKATCERHAAIVVNMQKQL